MSRSVKRFLFPIVLFILMAVFLATDTTEEYTELSGLLSTLLVFIELPLFVVTLVWSIAGGIHDHRLKKNGVQISKKLFPEIGSFINAVKADREEGKALSPDLRKRRFKFRLIGAVHIVIAFLLFATALTPLITIGTLLLIGGCTLILVSSPKAYSETVDGINMLICPEGVTLDRIYEDFKEYPTILGSVARGYAMPGKRPALFWGAEESNWTVWLFQEEGSLLYIGAGISAGCRRLTEPVYPAKTFRSDDFQGALCFNLEYQYFIQDFTEVLQHYMDTGELRPMPDYPQGAVYFFEEYFKLTGQRFALLNLKKEPVLYVEGTYPLKTLRIYDCDGNEVFRVTKELAHKLPHYLFYENGALCGEFSQNVDIFRDSFSMETKNGLLEMRENNTLIGENYALTMGEKRIGLIAERLNFTLENIVFDNMVLTVYDEKDLPLVTALSVMAAREMARDRVGEV